MPAVNLAENYRRSLSTGSLASSRSSTVTTSFPMLKRVTAALIVGPC